MTEPEINKPHPKGLIRILDAFKFSMKGYKAAYRYEESFRIELGFGIILFPLGFWLGDNAIERVVYILPLIMVLVAELLNSGIEAAIDRISVEHHPLSGRAKDFGSAACFTAQMSVILIWGMMLVEKFM
ncbi:MAG: diacylglycerol kinase [Chromatiales bacterium]|nr:diacylglycerol kinase [Chromatiales bacterium]